MKTITLPYHKDIIEFEFDEKYIEAVLWPKAFEYKTEKSQEELVEDALSEPFGCKRLEELAAGKKNIVIITSDHTRPVPASITLPAILRRVRRANRDIDVTILVATGSHRVSEYEELLKKLGGTIIRHEKVIVHDSRKKEDMASLGTLDSGLNAEVNKLITEADLLVADGYIAPHILSGFTGGADSVLPGAASLSFIIASRAKYLSSPCTWAGVLENNYMHLDAVETARRANLQFILNVVLNKDKEIIKAFAGDFNEAHLKGCEFVGEHSRVEANPADIVITTNGGYPLDQNIYQSVKGIAAAEACCKEGGVIIQAAACADGHGSESFYNALKNAGSPKALLKKYAEIPSGQASDGICQALILARILEKHRVIMVTDESQKGVVEDMFMEYAASIDEALTIARGFKGKEAKITVIPDGASVMVTPSID